MSKLSRLLFAAVLTVPLFAAGCAVHRQVYVWGPGETTYYVRWESERHLDHVEWEQRNEADRRAYWEWRRHHQ